VQLSGLKFTELINTKGQTYKKLKPELHSMDEQEIIQLIQENPSIMVRPILIADQDIVIGFKEDLYKAFLSKS